MWQAEFGHQNARLNHAFDCLIMRVRLGVETPPPPSFENARITFQVRFYLKSRFDLTATAVYK